MQCANVHIALHCLTIDLSTWHGGLAPGNNRFFGLNVNWQFGVCSKCFIAEGQQDNLEECHMAPSSPPWLSAAAQRWKHQICVSWWLPDQQAAASHNSTTLFSSGAILRITYLEPPKFLGQILEFNLSFIWWLPKLRRNCKRWIRTRQRPNIQPSDQLLSAFRLPAQNIWKFQQFIWTMVDLYFLLRLLHSIHLGSTFSNVDNEKSFFFTFFSLTWFLWNILSLQWVLNVLAFLNLH